MPLAGYLDPALAKRTLTANVRGSYYPSLLSEADLNTPAARLSRVLGSRPGRPGDQATQAVLYQPTASSARSDVRGLLEPNRSLPVYAPDVQELALKEYGSLAQGFYEPSGSAVLQRTAALKDQLRKANIQTLRERFPDVPEKVFAQEFAKLDPLYTQIQKSREAKKHFDIFGNVFKSVILGLVGYGVGQAVSGAASALGGVGGGGGAGGGVAGGAGGAVGPAAPSGLTVTGSALGPSADAGSASIGAALGGGGGGGGGAGGLLGGLSTLAAKAGGVFSGLSTMEKISLASLGLSAAGTGAQYLTQPRLPQAPPPVEAPTLDTAADAALKRQTAEQRRRAKAIVATALTGPQGILGAAPVERSVLTAYGGFS